MKILHTSDWHLGKRLYGQNRYLEFQAFLHWLLQTINQEKIDILLICGDIFDSSLPSNRALQLYYQFLHEISKSHCKHVVIIGGNHDSPSLLEAPKAILEVMNIYVIGACDNQNLNKELILLQESNQPKAIVCAVPYLRDRDIRFAELGESFDDKHLKMLRGIEKHYKELASLATEKQKEIKEQYQIDIPILATGHLFAAGGKTMSDDGVRDLYVGSLLSVGADVFSENFSYVALGHLHLEQKVNKQEHIRYCGSPIPLGFDEAHLTKTVICLELGEKCRADQSLEKDKENTNSPENQQSTLPDFPRNIYEICVPTFQELIKIKGNWQEIQHKIRSLIEAKSKAWLEVEYTGVDIIPLLSQKLEESIENTELIICRIRNIQFINQHVLTSKTQEELVDLDEYEVFKRCLQKHNTSQEDTEELMASYAEIIQALREKDINQE